MDSKEKSSPAKSTLQDKDQFHTAPVTIEELESNKHFIVLKDKFEKSEYTFSEWDKILCEEIGSEEVENWYEWCNKLHSLLMLRDKEPIVRPDDFKNTLDNANWETGNTEYRTLVEFLGDESKPAKDRDFFLGCLNELVLSVKVSDTAFELDERATPVAEEPGLEPDVGCDSFVGHMGYLLDHESNTRNAASPEPKVVEMDFFPIGRVLAAKRPADQSVPFQELSWGDTDFSLAWNFSEKSFYLVHLHLDPDTFLRDGLTSWFHLQAYVDKDDKNFTVAKVVAPSGVDLVKTKLKEALESEDVRLSFQSNSDPELVLAYVPGDIAFHYELSKLRLLSDRARHSQG